MAILRSDPARDHIDVFVVEDDSQQADLLCLLLSEAGYRVANCNSGEEALNILPDLNPRLILLDLGLSGIDGFQVCQQLKQVEKLARIPVIFLTVSQDRELEARGFEYGAADYLYKPVNDKVLLARVKTQLELKSYQDSLENLVQRRTDTLNQALQELSHSNKAKDRFLDTISHELRTPLNGISGGVQLLRQTELTTAQRELLDITQQSAADLSLILESVLDFSEANANKLELTEEPLDLADLFTDISAEATRRCEAKGLVFECHIDGDINAPVVGDGIKLRRLLGHILDNAIKFTKQGKVQLHINEYADDIRHWIQIQVIDTGIGIPAEQLSLTFAPFQQLNSAFNRRHGGLGIGLPICHAFVELMGGEIRIDSEPDLGTVVEVTLPLKPVDQLVKAPQKPIRRKTGSRSGCNTILIVEDNKVNQMVQKGVLKKLGFESVLAENGVEALEQVQKSDLLAILMDCQMPVMDGFEATQRIRALKSSVRELPIIAVTANAMSGDRQRCLESGMDDYLTKPLKMDELKVKLEQWVGYGQVQ